MGNNLSKILSGTKKTFQKHNKFVILLLPLLVVFTFVYSDRLSCKYTGVTQNCSFNSDGIVMQIVIALLVIGVVCLTIYFRGKLFSCLKYFWTKKPITALIIVLVLGIMPIPMRCTNLMLGGGGGGTPMLIDPGIFVAQCYSPLSREFWEQKDLESHVSSPAWIAINYLAQFDIFQ